MEKRFYLDTSIWLDFLEKRDEPSLPKGTWARKLIEKIIKNKDKILLSDVNILELGVIGYSEFEIEELLDELKAVIVHVESSESEIRKARDLSSKRNIPKRDALHALIARDNSALLIALDNHFKELKDISKPHSPKEFIPVS
jgi:predicted nucleic acid-binding protein